MLAYTRRIKRQSLLYLENGEPVHRLTQTFGANLYDLMKDSFFLSQFRYG